MRKVIFFNNLIFFIFIFYRHIPKAKATAIADTPELKRIAENTKIQSNVKYHEDFEKAKGKFTQVSNYNQKISNNKNILLHKTYVYQIILFFFFCFLFLFLFSFFHLNQTSAQRESDKNVSVSVRGMCITPRKIVSNYSFKQCSNKFCLHSIVLLNVIYYS